MRQNPRVTKLLHEGREGKRLAYATVAKDAEAMRYRKDKGELIEPMPNGFIEAARWKELNPVEQLSMMIRTVHAKHPDRVFAATSAALIRGWWVPWEAVDGHVHCASKRHGVSRGDAIVWHHYDPALAVRVKRCLVTDSVRTLIDCALTVPFVHALAIYDSAAREGINLAEVTSACATMRIDPAPVLRLVRHANPLSENGGESWVRATIIDMGYAEPQLQVTFHDAQTGRTYRVDFLWVLPDGTIVVLEYDGLEKYTSETMKDGVPTAQRAGDERERDAALERCGVARIAHVFHGQVADRAQLTRVLQRLGVP
ncbi:MAG: hypothetical protein UHD09_07505, partial [Bifidobacterium sp.]|nr:hypothetical protein [Bifidobacterium sp.]